MPGGGCRLTPIHGGVSTDAAYAEVSLTLDLFSRGMIFLPELHTLSNHKPT